jgi:hypothetical protein
MLSFMPITIPASFPAVLFLIFSSTAAAFANDSSAKTSRKAFKC